MRSTKPILAAFAAAQLVLLHATALAQTDPAWLDELKTQIQLDQECNPNYFLNIAEYRLGDDLIQEAKVVCIDGRQFGGSSGAGIKRLCSHASGLCGRA